jgi:hypothetical protein
VPLSYNIDTAKAVGEIPYSSSVLPNGRITYSVPIEAAALGPENNGYEMISQDVNGDGLSDLIKDGGIIFMPITPEETEYFKQM